MNSLTFDIIIILFLISLFLSSLIKIKIDKFEILIMLLILVITLPVFFGYFYNFKYLIFNQFIVAVALLGIFITVLNSFKKWKPLILFLSYFFIVVILVFRLIKNNKFDAYTYRVDHSEHFVENYYEEYLTFYQFNDKIVFKNPILCKYVFYNLFKKEINIEKIQYSDNGHTIYKYSDGKSVILDSLLNPKMFNNDFKEDLFDIATENCLKIKERNLGNNVSE